MAQAGLYMYPSIPIEHHHHYNHYNHRNVDIPSTPTQANALFP